MSLHIPGYRIIRKINQGGMATVYLAIQLSVGREVALKVMSPALNADPAFSKRFQQEANIVGQLSHPNIVSVYDIGCHQELNYIAMDYLPGGSVHDKMATGISQAEALNITSQIALALDHAHEKGYVHRDIKPENILFRDDGSAVLTDFGVAKALSNLAQVTTVGAVIGTPHYMSPEQARGNPLDGRADLYGLGILLYEMLTGSVPFRADDAVAVAIKHLSSTPPKLPLQHAPLQPLLSKLLAKEADDRFQRGRDVADAIHLLGGSGYRGGAQSTYLTTAEPTAIQILSLLRALLLTSYAALILKLAALAQWLNSWHYSLQLGLHRQPAAGNSTSRSQTCSASSERATVVSTAAGANTGLGATPLPRSLSNTDKLTLLAQLVLALTIAWLVLSMTINRFDLPGKQGLPLRLLSAAATTDHWFGSLFNSRSRAPANDAAVAALTAAPGSEANNINPVADSELEIIGEPPPDPLDTGLTPGQQAAESLAAESLATEPPPPPRFALTVTTEPPGARIRILNIREKYYAGIPLIPGDYQVEVSLGGYDYHLQWIQMPDHDLTLPIELRKKPVAGSVFHDDLGSGGKGPAMVIVPPGKFQMGNKGVGNASPTRQVTIARAFAISQYEITFADYQKFSAHSGRPLPADNRWGEGSRPVINVSWEDARAYTEWLSAATGKRYRLPSEAEWEYMARANSRTDYFWQDREDDGKVVRANCRRGCNSPFSNLLRAKTSPVGSFSSNPFKVYDSAGNVAEWVQDCYQNHYLAAPTDASPVRLDNCQLRPVRGGSVKTSIADIKSHSRDKRDPSRGYGDVGFRVLLELE